MEINADIGDDAAPCDASVPMPVKIMRNRRDFSLDGHMSWF